MSAAALLACRDLIVTHDGRRAVDGVSLELPAGASVAVVGESGCGKSTLVRALLRLVDPVGGEVLLDGATLWSGGRAGASALHRDLRRRVQYVPQDPVSSLNPRLTVEETVAEGALIHGHATGASRRDAARELLERVELGEEHLDRWPHQLSGGQRQRVAIARALAVRPDLLLLDEPTSALDVEVQGRVLALLRRLREGSGLGWMFVSHDLAVVRDLCEETVVMQDGHVVEQAATETLFREPGHPHTRRLLQAAGVSPGED